MADSDPVLAATSRLRTQEQELERTIATAERELAKIRAEGGVVRERLTCADQVKAKREEIAKAEAKVRHANSDENVAQVLRLRRELKKLTPEPQPESTSLAPVAFCHIDGLAFQNGSAPSIRVTPRETWLEVESLAPSRAVKLI
jgi:hypothetical protein